MYLFLAVKCSILRISAIMKIKCWNVGGYVESKYLGIALLAVRRIKDISFRDALDIPGKGGPEGNAWDSKV